MATYRGIIKHNGIEGGFWELHTDGGQRYQLRGGDERLRKEGARVEIDGEIDDGGMSIGMTGPILDVGALRSV